MIDIIVKNFDKITPVFFACIALYLTVRFRWWQGYVYLAQKWYEIQKLGMENPGFLNINKTQDFQIHFPQNASKNYGAFARTCWGFAEDIFHHSNHWKLGYLLSRTNFVDHYKETIKEYKKLHYAWFEKNKSFYGTKGFIEYIEKLEV